MLRKFKREKYQNLCISQKADQGAGVLAQGIKMIIRTRITGEEAAVGVEKGLNVIDIVGGTEIIGDELEVEVVVPVLTIAVSVLEADMMKRSAVEVDLMEVPLLLGAAQVLGRVHLQGEDLFLGMKVQMYVLTKIGLQLQRVCHPLVDEVVHAVLHPVLVLMNNEDECPSPAAVNIVAMA